MEPGSAGLNRRNSSDRRSFSEARSLSTSRILPESSPGYGKVHQVQRTSPVRFDDKPGTQLDPMKKPIGDLLNDIADAAAHAAAANARYCIRVDGSKVPLVSDETLPCSHIFLERCIKEMRRISIQADDKRGLWSPTALRASGDTA